MTESFDDVTNQEVLADVQKALDALPSFAPDVGIDIQTLAPRWTPHDIDVQFNKVLRNRWGPFFSDAARQYGFDVSLILGIASRETNIEQIVGDKGHGRGIMQIDDRAFPDFINSGQWKDVRLNIAFGAYVLRTAYQTIARGQGLTLTASIRGQRLSYVGARLDQDGLLRTAVSAYNCGGAAYYWMSTKGDPDLGTTGHDYSHDVMLRGAEFYKLLGNGQTS